MDRVDRILEIARKSNIPVKVYHGVITRKGQGIEMTVLIPNQTRRVYKGNGAIKNTLKQFPEEYLDATLKEIDSEKDRYQVAKKRLETLAKSNIADEDLRKRVIKLIERLCTPLRYNYANQVFLGNGVSMRLADSSLWETEGELHLQKIVAGPGTSHDYPIISEEKLILELADWENRKII